VISSLALSARIFDYPDLPVEVDDPAHPAGIDPARVTGHVRFENIRFTHPGAGWPALAGITLDVPAGSTLALAGETGSGKTTLASPIARFHHPGTGSVRINGIDVRDMRLTDPAAIIGVVSQETHPPHHGTGEPAPCQARRHRC
jgi:ATP-binding cassette subfamily B protein